MKQTLGLNTEAIEEYNKLLERDPDYVPALKGKLQHVCSVPIFFKSINDFKLSRSQHHVKPLKPSFLLLKNPTNLYNKWLIKHIEI